MRSPQVSVLMATHNGRLYIKEAIISVLKQSFQDTEFIIIDDGSTDGVDAIINSINDKRIILKKNSQHLGLTKSLNYGIEFARGEYLARIDDDDTWTDIHKLDKQVTLLKDNPKIGLVGTGGTIISGDKKTILSLHYPANDHQLREKMLLHNQFIHSSVVISKKALAETGHYNPNIRYSQDYELWLRVGTKYQLANLPSSSVRLRVVPGSISEGNHTAQLKSLIKTAYQYRHYYPNFYKFIPFYLREYLINTLPRRLVFKISGLRTSKNEAPHTPSSEYLTE